MNKNLLVFGGITVIASIALSILFGGNNVVTNIAREQLGGASSADENVPYKNVNGVMRYFNHMAFGQATGTACAFIAPSATSTLSSFTAQFLESTSTDIIAQIYKTSGAEVYATTSGTQIGTDFIISANVAGTEKDDLTPFIVASSSAGNSPTVFKPNEVVVMAMAFRAWEDDLAYQDSLTGNCSAVFETLER